jgi:outer membrane protein assembly factor BamA
MKAYCRLTPPPFMPNPTAASLDLRPKPSPRRLAATVDAMGALAATFATTLATALATTLAIACTAHAQSTDDPSMVERQERSPWLLVPLVSSSPKLGSSYGGMAGYVTQFDAASSPSMVAVQVKRSNTDSQVGLFGGKLYFNSDQDQVTFGIANGTIHNNYQDFAGTGLQVRSEEDVQAYFVRYLHGFAPHWFFGAQAVKGNYSIDGEDPLSTDILAQAGITGAVSTGIGLNLVYDSRDNVRNPADGMLVNFNNLAFRKMLGGENKYDALNADLRWYHRTNPHNVVVLHSEGRWTKDAPPSNESSISMRGYTRGQYLGKNLFTVEAENRYMFQAKWGAKAFGGVSCVYGSGKSCSGDNLFPMLGAGVFYLLKPKENMLVSAEFAKGNGDNQGFYLRFGHPF